jgi:sec-independent protein translocase protein TatC
VSQEDIDATRAPLLDHLIELRQRLIWSVVAFLVMFFICFAGAKYIFNILVWPYLWVAGPETKVELIYTNPLEYLFTQIKLAVFGAAFFGFPVIATQIYKFVAPGLYKNERDAFLPYLLATPFFFVLGAAVVYFIAMPIVMKFSLSMQQAASEGQAAITLLPQVKEYLSLIMTLIFAFGLCFQLPVVLTLLAKAGILDSGMLVDFRRYAIVCVFVVAAIFTPPDVISQLALAVPTLLLYEASIFAVRWIEKRRKAEAEREAEAS